MLISSMIGGADVSADDDEAGLREIAKTVINRLQPDRPSHPAVVAGLELELVALYKRMCHPLKSAVEQLFSELSAIGLAQWIRDQLSRCPVLDRALHEQSRQLITEFNVVEHRYMLDKLELRSVCSWVVDSKLDSVRIASADKHHGQHVLRLDFSGQHSLYYKPRSGSGAQLLADISHMLSQWGLELGAAKVLVRDGYHWMAEVQYHPALNGESAQRFAFNGGVLYAVASALNASDLHFENIVASHNGPVVVDCETLCQPRFSESAAAHLLKRPREEHDDVTSLFMNFDRYGGQEIDYGGLSCVDFFFRADPNAGLQVVLSSECRQLVQYHSRSAVEVEGRRIAPAVEYFELFVQGVRRASKCLKEHKGELLALIQPTSTFRVPLRATRVYAARLTERMSAICFSSYASDAWQTHVELDIVDAPLDFLLAARTIARQEEIDLSALDIPAAYVRADNDCLLLGGAVVSGVFDLSPLEVIRRRLERLSDAVVEEQIEILRMRLSKSSTLN
ncbi:hypothetical protein EOS_05825 [Caballeronia mineralivorans PML1(12)]|uniref:Lantibiotic biosynthesis protein dehydration domain-containing protein n=1 Tax=Caballeronia mineralivorans PML1(12) TaxID=908627 RepID=A0A0J1D3F1_9BURK|nr:DUF4135 domain-containing protein [Caballeronia mineralivorans]KLU27201.1 hypothetical protein EOS_05825 [Caballeronia mineralivorans PML1(12)]